MKAAAGLMLIVTLALQRMRYPEQCLRRRADGSCPAPACGDMGYRSGHGCRMLYPSSYIPSRSSRAATSASRSRSASRTRCRPSHRLG